MERLLLSCLCILYAIIAQAQVFFTQNFNISLAASGWTSTDLTAPWGNQTDFFGGQNIWQVNDNESGMPANTCGTGGVFNFSLHCGYIFFGIGLGAAYESSINTNRRIASPNISTVGKTNITLSFNFIGNGEGTTDKGYFQYSVNGGTSWISPTVAPTSASPALPVGSTLNNLKSQICGSGQGRWTNVTWTLPVAAENIPNFRIAFVWQSNNNANPTGDPSIAIDDITLSTPVVLPITLVSFTGKEYLSNSNLLAWATSSEINNDFFTLERSEDALNFEPIATIKGAGNSNTIRNYNYIDETLNLKHQTSNTQYYRLKQTDFDGQFEYFNTVAISRKESNEPDVYYYNKQLYINAKELKEGVVLKIIDVTGRTVYETSTSNAIINLNQLANGVYIYQLRLNNTIVSKKIVLQ